MDKVSESIWDNGKVIIPMAEVSHIEKDHANHSYLGGYWIIFKHSKPTTTPRFERQKLEPNVWLGGNDAVQFKKDWCYYRMEVESIPA